MNVFDQFDGPASSLFDSHIAEASNLFGVPVPLIRAVMGQESDGDPNSLSPKDAAGLMQVIPPTYAEMRSKYGQMAGIGEDRFDPRNSVMAGTAYLRDMLDQFGGDVPTALAAYNGGPGVGRRFAAGHPIPAETQNYVPAVMRRMPSNASKPSGVLDAVSNFLIPRAEAATVPRSPQNNDLDHLVDQVIAGGKPIPAKTRPVVDTVPNPFNQAGNVFDQFDGQTASGNVFDQFDERPGLLGEVGQGLVRAGRTTLSGLHHAANMVEDKIANLTGSEVLRQAADSDKAAAAEFDSRTQADYTPTVPSLSDIHGAGDAARYVIDKATGAAPTIAEFALAGPARMIASGALEGAAREYEQPDSTPASVAAGTGTGAALNALPVPFLHGAAGQGAVRQIARGAAGMGALGAVTPSLQGIPRAVATGETAPMIPSTNDVLESMATGAIQGAAFGGVGAINGRMARGRADQPVTAGADSIDPQARLTPEGQPEELHPLDAFINGVELLDRAPMAEAAANAGAGLAPPEPVRRPDLSVPEPAPADIRALPAPETPLALPSPETVYGSGFTMREPSPETPPLALPPPSQTRGDGFVMGENPADVARGAEIATVQQLIDKRQREMGKLQERIAAQADPAERVRMTLLFRQKARDVQAARERLETLAPSRSPGDVLELLPERNAALPEAAVAGADTPPADARPPAVEPAASSEVSSPRAPQPGDRVLVTSRTGKSYEATFEADLGSKIRVRRDDGKAFVPMKAANKIEAIAQEPAEPSAVAERSPGTLDRASMLPPRQSRISPAAPTDAVLVNTLNRADATRHEPRLTGEQKEAAEAARTDIINQLREAASSPEAFKNAEWTRRANQHRDWAASAIRPGIDRDRFQEGWDAVVYGGNDESPISSNFQSNYRKGAEQATQWIKKNPRPAHQTPIEIVARGSRGQVTRFSLKPDADAINAVIKKIERLPDTRFQAGDLSESAHTMGSPISTEARLKIESELNSLVSRLTGGRLTARAHDLLLDDAGGPVRGAITGRIIHAALLDPRTGQARLGGAVRATARHEVIHFLRDNGILDEPAWKALSARAAIWRDHFDIDGRYQGYRLSDAQLDEEAIAEAYAAWAEGSLRGVTGVNRAFHMIRKFYEEVRAAVRRVLGYEPDATDVFTQIEHGDFGRVGDIGPAERAPAFQADVHQMASALDYFDRYVAGKPKGALVPERRFVVASLAPDTVARAAQLVPDFAEAAPVVRVSGRALKHLNEQRPGHARAILARLPELIRNPAEVLPNTQRTSSVLLARPIGGENNAPRNVRHDVAVLEIAPSSDGIDIVSIHIMPERTLEKKRGAGGTAPDQKVDSPHPLGDTGASPHAEADFPTSRPTDGSVVPVEDEGKTRYQVAPPPADPKRTLTDRLLDTAPARWLDSVVSSVAPMGARDSAPEARAIAKDFSNGSRLAQHRIQRFDQMLRKEFSPAERKAMWEAGDEQSVMEQSGKVDPARGYGRLSPRQKQAMLAMRAWSEDVWKRAVAAGIVEGDGLPAYMPRLLVRIGDDGVKSLDKSGESIPLDQLGANLRTRGPEHRRYLTSGETEEAARAKFGDEGVGIVRDVRALPLAVGRLERSVAGRELVNRVKEYGQTTGRKLVSDGKEPGFVTINHPAFMAYRPEMVEDPITGKMRLPQDADGNPVTIMKGYPLFVAKDFVNPLRAVLSTKPGPVYQGFMGLKSSAMSAIMWSPLTHNMVEWGRAMPLYPGKVLTLKIYFEGNAAKRDPKVMDEAIRNGLVPIGGHQGALEDLIGIATHDSLEPGRGLVAKGAKVALGTFSKPLGRAAAAGIDRFGDFWHGTLLWDRVGDLQMGIYKNMMADLTRKGWDRQTASRTAAHFANRYAGALPREAMGETATRLANVAMFSRTFTIGNLGVMKDMITGLPKDLQAQIERDAGAVAAYAAKSLARKKAIYAFALDIGLMMATGAVLQNAFDYLNRDQSLGDIGKGYVERFRRLLDDVSNDPFQALSPLHLLGALTPNSENEPGKENRILYGRDARDTAVYMRSPAGKVGEEFVGYLTRPLDMLKAKLSTVTRPALEAWSNDAGFDRPIYNANDTDTPAGVLRALGNVVGHFMASQLPTGTLETMADVLAGSGDKEVNKLKLAGELTGFTFSQGYPGGPAKGEIAAAKRRHDTDVKMAAPRINKALKDGDLDRAEKLMDSAGMTPDEKKRQLGAVNAPGRLSPQTLNRFQQYATPNEKGRLDRALNRP